jgi:hypothetical protein
MPLRILAKQAAVIIFWASPNAKQPCFFLLAVKLSGHDSDIGKFAFIRSIG